MGGRRKETLCSGGGGGWEGVGKKHHVQEVGSREKERDTMFRSWVGGKRKETSCSGGGWEGEGKRHHVQERPLCQVR